MKKLTSSFIVLSLLFFALNASAGDARIDDVSVALAPELNVSFVVRNAFTKEIEEAIKSGVPTSFKFIVRLERLRGLWMNEDVGSREFRHVVKYDSLKEEYEITMEESGPVALKTGDFNEMKKDMTIAGPVRITPVAPLEPGETYDLRVMAELKTTKLPFLLDYVFFFVRYWDFETDWHVYRFKF